MRMASDPHVIDDDLGAGRIEADVYAEVNRGGRR